MRSTSTTEAAKAEARRACRAALEALTAVERRRSDDALFAAFLALPELSGAKTVLLYCGMGAEPDTARLFEPLRARGVRVALPRCLPDRGMEARLVSPGDGLVRHPYGMLEPGEGCAPLAREEIGLILAPGLCFDKKCFRLGQGGGYYDRYLTGFGGVTAALCRDMLLMDAVPRAGHDAPVDIVVTETRVLRR